MSEAKSAEVTALRVGGKMTKTTLVQLGMDEELESFAVVCVWKDGTCSVGWPADLKSCELTYMAAALDVEVKEQVFDK